MVDFKVLITPPASADLEKRVPTRLKPEIARRIRALAQEPYPSGIKRLHVAGVLYRIRVGDYRVIYSVNMRNKTVVVEKIGHRKEVYRFLQR